MSKTYQIHVFGKPGCDKATRLMAADDLLQETEWAILKSYHDLETENTRGVLRSRVPESPACPGFVSGQSGDRCRGAAA